MFVEKRVTWLATVTLGGVALPHIWMRTLAVTGLSIVVTILYLRVPWLHYSVSATPFALIGLPLGIFLGFRNNTAYDRFWEGSKLWGSLVNTSRSLTRQILTLIEPQPEAPDQDPEAVRLQEVAMVHMLIAYVHALRHHLRESDPFPTLTRILSAEEARRFEGEENVPIAILQRIAEQMVEARRKRWIHALHVPVIEGSLTAITDIQGACERIKSTPIPYSYTVLMHRLVAMYCLLLPFGLQDTAGWATPGVVLCISYALFGLDAIGDEVEQPFGLDPNDLPLSSMSRNIESNLRRRIGEPPPKPFAPRKGILS
ncbi:MAG TPA: bestrophin family protein [Labilithrix sp.]|nr:bestrophin family protein [Labilithrix sp.]